MPEPDHRCPECGADWSSGTTCTDHFHQLGFWELDHQLYEVHHLMVLCYFLQHPSLYSPEGLRDAVQILALFLEEGLSPQQVRKRRAKALDSGTRPYPISARPDAHGAYARPIRWTMTIADVTAAGIEQYYRQVRAWADSVHRALHDSGNLE